MVWGMLAGLAIIASLFGFFLVAGIWQRLFGRRRGPGDIVKDALRCFASSSESEIAAFEHEAFHCFPRAPEQGLLYALRVSRVISRVTNLKTLASRWNVANCGAAQSGLSTSRAASLHPEVEQFLSAIYLDRLNMLLAIRVEEDASRILARKSPVTRASAAAKAVAAMEQLKAEFVYELPGARESIEQCRSCLASIVLPTT